MNLEILAKYLSGEANKDEISYVDNWLQQDSKNLEILEAYKTAWNLPEKINEKSDLPKIWNQISENIESSEQSKSNILDYISDLLFGKLTPAIKYSFVAIILLIPLVLFIFNTFDSLITFEANDLTHSKITLSDGSIVTLDRASKIIYPETFNDNERKVEIYGEVFFEVKSDPEKPFIININNCTITVLGTSFNVRGWDEKISVAVVEGKVKFSSEVNKVKDSVILVKNQESQISKNGFPSNPINTDPNKSIRWIKGYYDFESATVNEVKLQLERWYDVKISFADEAITSELINISIDKSSLSKNLDILTPLIGTSYSINKNKIVIR